MYTTTNSAGVEVPRGVGVEAVPIEAFLEVGKRYIIVKRRGT